jgi:precorrin-2 dehydrogenase/sirohydrochlorin ferrochelatase
LHVNCYWKGCFVLPLILDIRQRRIVVVGRGYAAQQRVEFAREAGAEELALYVIDQDGWACHLEAAVYERLPVRADLEGAAVVLVAGLPAEETAEIVAHARAVGALVNAEDQPELCDFHVPAVVRRGDLLLTVSTGGKAAGLSQRIRAHLEALFGPAWTHHVRAVVEARARWRAEGRPKNEVARLTQAMVEREGWLKTGELV